jgi:hypothetical protein
VVIDDYADNTGDKSLRSGHYYSDKAPGLSVLAATVWWPIVHAVADGKPRGRHIHLGAYLATLIGVGLPSALGVAMLFRTAYRWGSSPWAAAALALAYALGTQALPYATLFYSHQLVAGLFLLALGLLVEGRALGRPQAPGRLFLVGFLLGYAIVSEYPAALGAAVVAAYGAWIVRPSKRLLWMAAGATLPILGLMAYHTAAWGGPFVTGYSFHVVPGRDTGGLLPGVTLPDLRLLPKLLFSLERGIIRFSPWLALAVPGAFLMLRSRTLRAEGIVCATVIVFFLALNCAQTLTPDDWRGGAGLGPRYLVPSLPFYALAMVGLLAPSSRPGWLAEGLLRGLLAALFALVVVVSAGRMFVATAVAPEVSRVDDPFEDYLLPLWREDRVGVNAAAFHHGERRTPKQAWNLGERMGLSGRLSLLPLAAFVFAAGAWLAHTLARPLARPPTGPR